jgi:hypothetical protein
MCEEGYLAKAHDMLLPFKQAGVLAVGNGL